MASSRKDLIDMKEHRTSFDVYKSCVCHELKEKGDINFVIDNLKKNKVKELFEKKWYLAKLFQSFLNTI